MPMKRVRVDSAVVDECAVLALYYFHDMAGLSETRKCNLKPAV